MKRSEMIKTMVNAYSSRIKDQMIYFDEEDAARVLEAMEAIGMQPPPHQERRGSGYPDEYGNEEIWDEWVQGWESE
jgi:hypothetical protein